MSEFTDATNYDIPKSEPEFSILNNYSVQDLLNKKEELKNDIKNTPKDDREEINSLQSQLKNVITQIHEPLTTDVSSQDTSSFFNELFNNGFEERVGKEIAAIKVKSGLKHKSSVKRCQNGSRRNKSTGKCSKNRSTKKRSTKRKSKKRSTKRKSKKRSTKRRSTKRK